MILIHQHSPRDQLTLLVRLEDKLPRPPSVHLLYQPLQEMLWPQIEFEDNFFVEVGWV